jgi:hypothetical protein
MWQDEYIPFPAVFQTKLVGSFAFPTTQALWSYDPDNRRLGKKIVVENCSFFFRLSEKASAKGLGFAI